VPIWFAYLSESVWAYGLTAIAAVVVLWFLEVRKVRKQQDRTQKKQEKFYKHIIPREPYPNDDEHRASEQAYWVWYIKTQHRATRINIVTAIFAAFAAGGGYLTYIQAKRQADISHDQLIASSRAWMDISIDQKTVSLGWVVNRRYTPALSADLTIENKGSSPAIDVVPTMILRVENLNGLGDWKSVVKETCSRIKGLERQIVFVGKPITGNFHNFYINIEKEFIAHRSAVAAGDGVPAESITWVPLTLTLCVTYHVIGDDSPHLTARFFQVRKVRAVAGGGTQYDAFHIGEDAGPGGMRLDEAYAGDYAD
jgi:hypothetical protein